jgi:hypothetical protein
MEMGWVIKGLPVPARLVGFAILAAAGVAVQFLLPGAGGVALGLLVMVPALLLVWSKNYRNRPVDLGFEDWQPASAVEFNRIRQNLAASRERRFSALHKPALGTFLIIASLVLAFIFRVSAGRLAGVAFLDLAALLVPFAFGGNVYLWTPRQLAFRMACLEPVIAAEPEGGDIVVTPYLRLDKDKEGRQIPEDVRLMAEPRRKPADFLGVQFQVAVNNGPNGPVPYVYAVFLCRGKGPTYEALRRMDFVDYVREPGGDKEYGYVVVRQRTERGGYHTDAGDVRRLYGMVRERLLRLARG